MSTCALSLCLHPCKQLRDSHPWKPHTDLHILEEQQSETGFAPGLQRSNCETVEQGWHLHSLANRRASWQCLPGPQFWIVCAAKWMQECVARCLWVGMLIQGIATSPCMWLCASVHRLEQSFAGRHTIIQLLGAQQSSGCCVCRLTAWKLTSRSIAYGVQEQCIDGNLRDSSEEGWSGAHFFRRDTSSDSDSLSTSA